jgi:hypothetical protein
LLRAAINRTLRDRQTAPLGKRETIAMPMSVRGDGYVAVRGSSS